MPTLCITGKLDCQLLFDAVHRVAIAQGGHIGHLIRIFVRQGKHVDFQLGWNVLTYRTHSVATT